MMKLAVLSCFLLAVLPALIDAQLNKLEWSDCGSKEIVFKKIDMVPMPVVHPGTGRLTFMSVFKRALTGKLKTKLEIKRTVSGITLPISCYLAAGIYVGSCTYDDLCAIVAKLLPNSFNPTACPAIAKQFGIDCTCPFNIMKGDINLEEILLNIPDASKTIATFLASGDFNVKINSADSKGDFGCINIKFSVRKA